MPLSHRRRAAASAAAATRLVITGAILASLVGCATSHKLAAHQRSRVAGRLAGLIVGAPGPALHCTETLAVGADIQATLSQAKPKDVICLATGSYGDVTLTGISHSANVTLGPAPGASVHFGKLLFTGPAPSANLTVQGLHIDSGVDYLTGTAGGVVFRNNTIENIPNGFAYYFYANGSSSGGYTQRGVKLLYNQIDHVGACLEVDGGSSVAFSFTFSHNVCGPGIGAGATTAKNASHYIQIGGISGFSAQSNAFLGPMDPNYQRVGLHNNVLHVFGDSSNIDFSNNLIWHGQSRGQTILMEEGRLEDITINNNLDVEDPACDRLGDCNGYAIYLYDASGLTVRYNAIVDSYWGLLLTNSSSGSLFRGRDYDISHNIVVGAKGNPDISYHCLSGCVFDDNVTDDRSASQGGAMRSVTDFRPTWRSASWAPPAPYFPPPQGYYRATNLPPDLGYQTAVGP